MKWYLFILPYLLCFALITWGASQVQFIFGNEPIWLHHSKKMKLWKLPQNRRFSFEVWSSLPLAQLYGWKEDNICQSMHGKVSIYCPSGKWSVDSPLSTPNTTCKKYPLPPPRPPTPLYSTPPTRQKGRPLHCMTRLLIGCMEILFLQLAATIFGLDE